MLSSNMLEIAIGVTITYLFMALVVTAFHELVASYTKARAKYLVMGISKLLDGKSKPPKASNSQHNRGEQVPTSTWTERFFGHHLINGLSRNGEKPSYVPSQTFAMVLLQLLGRAVPSQAPNGKVLGNISFDELETMIGAIQNEDLKEALIPLLEEARSAVHAKGLAFKRFCDQIEIWYDHAMDRVSGWYKRRTQAMLLVFSFGLAFALNVDTFKLCEQLAKNDVLRAAVVEQAKVLVTMPQARDQIKTPDPHEAVANLNSAVANLQGIGIPLGWEQEGTIPLWSWAALKKFLGILLSALAISLGAPFWFDLLNKFISIRGAGKPPEERPKAPKMVLQPQAPLDTP